MFLDSSLDAIWSSFRDQVVSLDAIRSSKQLSKLSIRDQVVFLDAIWSSIRDQAVFLDAIWSSIRDQELLQVAAQVGF